MKHPVHNSRRQQVGFIDDETKTYHTQRYMSKGQIFMKKNWFGGKYIHRGMAIDEEILDWLLKKGVTKTEIVVIGLEPMSFTVVFDNNKIKSEGVLINYDRRKNGQSYTGYATQVVFGMDWGERKLRGEKQARL